MGALRDKIHADAERRLEALINEADKALNRISDDTVSSTDLAKLVSSNRSKTLRHRLLAQLRETVESELVEHYNQQLEIHHGEQAD